MVAIILLFTGSLVCIAQESNQMKSSIEAFNEIIEIAGKSKTAKEAKKLFDGNEKLKSKCSFSSDTDSWEIVLSSGISSREICKELHLDRCYLVSGDVHQSNFSLMVWTEDLKDENGPRISAELPKIKKWKLNARGERPEGELPKLSCGASPAYDVKKFDTKVKSFSFSL